MLGARAVAGLVRERGYDTLLAGIGTSHMAAWLAARLLANDGVHVQVAAELGLQSMDPEPGDVFLFSQRHAERSQMLAGVAETLGGAVAANPAAWGALRRGDRPGRQHQHHAAARRPLDHRFGRGQRHRLVGGLRRRRGCLGSPLRTAPGPPHKSGPAGP
ncbi:hypothetical protein NKH18_42315 [Streptomyces sp. M10(2022)]